MGAERVESTSQHSVSSADVLRTATRHLAPKQDGFFRSCVEAQPRAMLVGGPSAALGRLQLRQDPNILLMPAGVRNLDRILIHTVLCTYALLLFGARKRLAVSTHLLCPTLVQLPYKHRQSLHTNK